MEYFLYGSKNFTKNNTDCTLTNIFGITEFVYVMNKL
jgi:hypothetical protein